MKLILSGFIVLFLALTANGQNFFFIGENSYPCTKSFTLQSNSDDSEVNDLNVLFGKDGTKGALIVSIKTNSILRINGKLIIYLDDGTVISCIDKGVKDNVDDIASTVYQLATDELAKIKNSNINKIRYEMKCTEGHMHYLEGNYSASNKGSSKTDFSTLVSEFFDLQ